MADPQGLITHAIRSVTQEFVIFGTLGCDLPTLRAFQPLA
jgi:hypothetical protein